MRTTVVIADDHPIFRHGLRTLIEASQDFELVGEASDGIEALKLIDEKQPAIAVLDVAMPGMNGLEVIRQARRHSFDGKCVVLTMYKEEEYFNEAMDLGVIGYILKESAVSDLLACLRNASRRRYFVSPAFTDTLVWRTTRRDALNQEQPSLSRLTPMELRVLKVLADGKASQEIANELGISLRTVQNHRAHICTKLGLEGHNKLLLFALHHRSLL